MKILRKRKVGDCFFVTVRAEDYVDGNTSPVGGDESNIVQRTKTRSQGSWTKRLREISPTASTSPETTQTETNHSTKKKIIEGWMGKEKGLDQSCWERGLTDPNKTYKVDERKDILPACTDFQ